MKICDLAAGVTVGDRYRLVDLLGHGGFGDVWKADRLADLQPVALKVYHEQERGHRVLVQEAQQAKQFNHPRLVRVYDAGRVDGIYCMEMEYVEGPTLARRLGDLEQPLYVSVDTAIEWMMQVAEGLAYLHGLKPPVSHGDIKPENLILSPTAGIKLTDFGHSRQIEDKLVITVGGGTWLYMAPEVHDQSQRHIASDIYSFGVMFYRVLTGRFPRQTLSEMLNQTPFPRPSELNSRIPGQLDDLVLRCLERSPADRYQDGITLLPSLCALLQELAKAPTRGEQFQVVTAAPLARPMDFLEEAHRLGASGDFVHALAAVDRAIGQVSTNREVLLLHGHLAERCERFQVAHATFNKLVHWLEAREALPAEQQEPRERLGSIQVRLKNYEGAVVTFGYLHESFADDLWYAYKYGIALGLAGRPRDSIEVLEDVRQRRPDLASVAAKIGFGYLQLRQHRTAAQYFNEALMVDEFEPTALYHLALIRSLEGRGDRALTYLERLRQADGAEKLAMELARQLGVTGTANHG